MKNLTQKNYKRDEVFIKKKWMKITNETDVTYRKWSKHYPQLTSYFYIIFI